MGGDAVSARKALDKSAVVVVLAHQFFSYVQDPQATHTLTENGLDTIVSSVAARLKDGLANCIQRATTRPTQELPCPRGRGCLRS